MYTLSSRCTAREHDESIVPRGRVLRRIRRNYDDNLREAEGGVGILPGIVIPDITLGLKGMRVSMAAILGLGMKCLAY